MPEINSNIANGGRHRRIDPYQSKHRRYGKVREAGRRTARRPAVIALLASIGIGSLAVVPGSLPGVSGSILTLDVSSELADGRSQQAASRSDERGGSVAPAIPTGGISPASDTTRGTPDILRFVPTHGTMVSDPPAPRPKPPTPAPPTTPPPRKPPAPKPPAPPKPPATVAGLSQSQTRYAATIVKVGQELKLPTRAYVVAIATALQESNLQNLANPALPESLDLPNDGLGYDHDSVGLFQQRTSSGWGTVAELMDPATSARRFYQALAQIGGWPDMPISAAAQSVQQSAFPDAYAQHESQADEIVDALT